MLITATQITIIQLKLDKGPSASVENSSWTTFGKGLNKNPVQFGYQYTKSTTFIHFRPCSCF